METLHVVLNKSLRQHPAEQQLSGHLPLISQTIQVRLARLAGHFWESKEKLLSKVLQWTPTHGHTSAGQIAKTFIHLPWVLPRGLTKCDDQ